MMYVQIIANQMCKSKKKADSSIGLLTRYKPWTAMLYNLGRGSWLAKASGTGAHSAVRMQYDTKPQAPANALGLQQVTIHQMSPPVRGTVAHIQLQLTTIYRPRKDERLSWPGWLTCSVWFTHNSGHSSAAGRAQESESSLASDRRSNNWAMWPTDIFWDTVSVMPIFGKRLHREIMQNN